MSLQTYTLNLGGWLHLAAKDDVTTLPVEGLVHNSGTYQIEKQGLAGVATKSTVSGDWLETDNGGYQIRLTSLAGGLPGDGVSNDTDTLGTHQLHATINGTTVMIPYAVVAAGGGGGASAADIADAVCDELLSGHVVSGSVAAALTAVKAKTDALTPANLDVAVSTRLASGTVASDLTAVKAKTDALTPANLDVAVSTRLASGTVAADVTAVKAKTDALPSDPADQSVVIAATDAILTAVGTKASQASLDTVAGGLLKLLALGGDNVVIDAIVDPGTGATSIRQRGYNSSANADAAYASSPSGGTTGLVYTFTHAAEYSGDSLTKSKRTTS